MAVAGPNSPSEAQNVFFVFGSNNWINPTNVFASDNSYAVASGTSAGTQWLQATSFGFNIPAGSTIEGIVAEIEVSSADGNVRDGSIRIIKGGIVGSTERGKGLSFPQSDVIREFGSPSDLWGETWTPADINDDGFGLAMRAARITGSSMTARVDHITLTVYYSPPNVAPTIPSASTTYSNGTATGPNSTWGLTFTATDADAGDQGADALAYEIRTGADGTGTLIDSGTCTHNVPEVVAGLAYTAVPSEGNNTVYLRVSDGDEWSADTALTVRRDSIAPTVGTITHDPDPVGQDRQYTVTFTPQDAGGSLAYGMYTGPNATGTLLTGFSSVSSGTPHTTPVITDTVEAANLIANPGMETDISGWIARQGTEALARDTTEPHSGSASLRVTPLDVSDGVYHAYAGQAEVEYRHRMWVRVPAGITVRLYAYDNVSGFTLLDTAAGTGDWERLEGTVTTGGGATAFRTYAIVESASVAPWWVDDVTVVPISAGLQHGSNTRYLYIIDGAGNVLDQPFTVEADILIEVPLILKTRVEAELHAPLILRTMVGVVPLEAPLILKTHVEPSLSRIERHLSGAAGAMGHRLRFEARTKTGQFLRDVTSGILTTGASIECNNDRPIKRTAQFRCNPDEFDFDVRREYLAVYYSHLIDGRYWLEWPLGLFRVDEPQRTIRPEGEEWSINGFDLARLLVDDMPGSGYVIPKGTNRMAHAAGVLDDLGLLHALPTSDITAKSDVTFEPTATWLEIVNDDAQAAGMYTIWPRAEDARFTTRIPGDIASRTPDAAYDLLGFILAEPISLGTDMNRFANRVVVTSTGAGLSAEAVNDDPSSPVSTVSLGWQKTKNFTVDAVDDLTVLQSRADRDLREATSAYVRLGLTTHIDPRRGPFELITVDGGARFGTDNWYVRNWRMDLSETGQRMTWELSRVESYL